MRFSGGIVEGHVVLFLACSCQWILFQILREQPSSDILHGLACTSLSNRYGFRKPNDEAALNLMNAVACAVVRDMPDLCIAYGVSDEYR